MTRTLAVLALCLLASTTWAARRPDIQCAGPAGSVLHLGGPINPPPDDMHQPIAELVRYRPGDWRKVAMVHEGLIQWPEGSTLFLVCGACERPALDLYAVTADGDLIPVWSRINPDGMDRLPWKDGRMATRLIARFSVDSCRSEPSGLRVGYTREGSTGR